MSEHKYLTTEELDGLRARIEDTEKAVYYVEVSRLISDLDALRADLKRTQDENKKLRDYHDATHAAAGFGYPESRLDGIDSDRDAVVEIFSQLTRERDGAQSLLASATDLLNSWARESYTTEAKTESDIKGVIDRLWSYWSAEIARMRGELNTARLVIKPLDGWERAEALSDKKRAEGLFNTNCDLRNELDRMRKALEDADHAVNCSSRQEVHRTGFIHYETDAGEPCPIYHYGRGECDCFKQALHPQPAQPEKVEPKKFQEGYPVYICRNCNLNYEEHGKDEVCPASTTTC